MKHWTKEEEELMIKELQKEGAYLNLKKCFVVIAKKLDRTPISVCNYYYHKVRKEGVIFVTMSKGSIAPNIKVGDYREPVKPEHSLWSKILKFFKK